MFEVSTANRIFTEKAIVVSIRYSSNNIYAEMTSFAYGEPPSHLRLSCKAGGLQSEELSNHNDYSEFHHIIMRPFQI